VKKVLHPIIFYLLCTVAGHSQNLIVSNDTTICIGGSASLTATPTGTGYGTDSYTFQVIPYQPESYFGGTGITFGSNGDDQIAGPYNIGFTFCFFNQNYTEFWVGSNGWVGFTYNAAWTTYVPTQIPNTANGVPKNCIMAPWQDWYPGNGGTFTPPYVFYKMIGTAPNRKLVVYWQDCPMYGCLTTYGRFQIVLNEQNSSVENHLTSKPYCNWQNNGATQGVHNADGTVAFTAPGRNFTDWTATNESTRFIPSGVKWYTGGYPGGTIVGYGQTLVVSPAVTTIYTAVVENCAGTGNFSANVTVTVIDAAFNYPSAAFCKNQPNPTPTLLQPGGTFSSSPTGLVFVSNVTGEINLLASTAGTYTISRTITTPCLVSATQQITVNTPPSPPVPTSPVFFRCGEGPITLSVIPQSDETYYWYDVPAGGTPYPSPGPNLTTSVTVTTTFFVEAKDTVIQCVSETRTPVIGEVRPGPAITNSITNFDICSDETTNILLQSNMPSSTFSWVASCSSPQVTGFSDGMGNTIIQVLHNSGFSDETVTYTVTASSNQCAGLPVDFTVTVHPVPDLILSPSAQTICTGSITSINLSSTAPGVSFTWTASGTSGITGYSPGSGIIIEQGLFNAGNSQGSANYIVTPAIGTCSGTPGSVTITILPAAQVSLQVCMDTLTTTQGQPLKLKGGIPPGGVFSGSGVNSATGVFTPSVAGTGVHTIYYTYTNMFGCPRKDSLRMTVLAPASLTCGDPLTDVRDARVYPTVLIGTQCWMAANLNYGQQVSSSTSQRDNCIVEKYCFNDLSAGCSFSGGRYQWDEVMAYQSSEGAQGFCPPGWHLPSEAEWAILFNNFINSGFAGSALKVTGYSGFNALPDGFKGFNVIWKYGPADPTLRSTLYWSSTLYGSKKAWAHGMNEVEINIEYTASVSYYPSMRNNAFSVRCVKD